MKIDITLSIAEMNEGDVSETLSASSFEVKLSRKRVIPAIYHMQQTINITIASGLFKHIVLKSKLSNLCDLM